MDFSKIFDLVNLGTGGVMMFGAISQFIHPTLSSAIIGAYVVIFSLAIISIQLLQSPPPVLSRYASFLFSFIGRGVFYVFVGSIILDGGVLRHIAGTIIGAVGLVFIGLEFVPSIELPPSMGGEEEGWGAEQI